MIPEIEDIILKKVSLYGYCSFTTQKLAEIFLNQEEYLISEALGNFVVIWEDENRTIIVTSTIGIIPYYYYFEDNLFTHGKEILEVFRSCKKSWEWDFCALADYLVFNHVIDSSTLHTKIKKTSANTILYFENGKIIEKTLKNINQNRKEVFTSPYHSINCLSSELITWIDRSNTVLSISGGFDSRLLLAILLSHGIKPTLVVSGQENSFDLEVSKCISKEFDLPLLVTELKSSDIKNHADKTIRATGGMLPIPHWAGHLWAASHDQSSPIIVGFNGELARSYYFDKGVISYILNYTPSSCIKRFLGIYIDPEIKNFANNFNPRLHAEFSVNSENIRFQKMMSFSGSNTLEKLDSFFSNSYTRNKTGMDVSALGKHVNWIAPFCSASWVESLQNLSRYWKLDSQFHRFAINFLFPKLLSFPEEGRSNKMNLKSKALYWIRKKEVVPFYNIEILMQSNVDELIREGITNLEDIISNESIHLLLNPKSVQLKLLAYKLAPVGLFMKLVKNGY